MWQPADRRLGEMIDKVNDLLHDRELAKMMDQAEDDWNKTLKKLWPLKKEQSNSI